MKQIIVLCSILGIALACGTFGQHSEAPKPKLQIAAPWATTQNTSQVVGKNIAGKSSIKSFGKLSRLRHPPTYTEEAAFLSLGDTINTIKQGAYQLFGRVGSGEEEEISFLQEGRKIGTIMQGKKAIVKPKSGQNQGQQEENTEEEIEAIQVMKKIGTTLKGGFMIANKKDELPQEPPSRSLEELEDLAITIRTIVGGKNSIKEADLKAPSATTASDIKLTPVQKDTTTDAILHVAGSNVGGKASIKSFGSLNSNRRPPTPTPPNF